MYICISICQAIANKVNAKLGCADPTGMDSYQQHTGMQALHGLHWKKSHRCIPHTNGYYNTAGITVYIEIPVEKVQVNK